MIDPWNLIDERFKRTDELLFNLFGRSSRQKRLHDRRRHGDLRIFFARRRENGVKAENQRGKNQNKRELRIDEKRREPSGEIVLAHDRGPFISSLRRSASFPPIEAT